MQRLDRRLLVALLLLCSLSSNLPRAQALVQAGQTQCGPNCAEISTDDTDSTAPPLFLNAVMNDSISEIVLTASRYQLKPQAWAPYGPSNLYVLRRNLTIRSTFKPIGLMDFQLLERKMLVDARVTVTFKNIVLQNIRKLGGFGLDFFVGNPGSQVTLQDVVRVKLACQLPADVLRSARTYARVSPAYPNNSVTLIPRFCFTAALVYGQPVQHCFEDALHFKAFSLVSASNDPDSGSQFPGYVLLQQNTTRVCKYTITKDCLTAHNGDEELCLAMLVTQNLSGNQRGFRWSPGALAGVVIAGSVVLLALVLCTLYRNHIVLWCVRMDGKSLQDLESGSSQWVTQHALPCTLGQMPEDDFTDKELALEDNGQGYVGRRAISQQVTLGVLLGAGSFGRVYRGRWHSSDVAIKIVSCTRAELARVLREAEVMMQLNHPNIVRAFQASVWNPAEQARALQAREARGSSAGGASKKPPQKRFSSRLSPAISSTLQQQQPRTSTTASSPLASGQLRTNSCDSSSLLDVSNTTSGNSLIVAAGPPAAAVGATVPPPTPAPPAAGAAQEGSIELPVLPVAVPWSNTMQAGDSAVAAAPGNVARSVNATPHQWGQQGAAAASQQPASTSMLHVVELGNGVSAASPSHSSACNVAGVSNSSRLAADGTAASSAKGSTSSAAAAGSGSSTAAGAQQQQQHGSLGASSSSHPSAVAEAREQSSPTEAAPAATDTSAAAPAAAPAAGVRFKQHLLGKLRRSSSGSSTPVRGSDGTAAAAAASGSSSTSAAAAAGPAVVFGIDLQQQQQQLGEPGSSRQKRRRWQEREQEHASGEVAAAAATANTSDSQPKGQPEEGQRSEVQVWLVLELCTGGTLKDAVTTGRLRLEDNIGLVKLLSRLSETAKGMAYLHSKGVMHGDLKAGNVLLQNVHGAFDQVAKISDFGLAAVLLDGATHRSTASMGTITHMAPEVLRSGHISPAADVYSFAIMMWEVFTTRQAYQGLHYGAVVERVVIQKQRPSIPDDMPHEYSLLMSTCWDAEPNNRPSFSQIVTCLELMIDNLTNEVEAADRLDDLSGAMVQGSGSAAGFAAAAVTMGTAGPARFAASGDGGSSDQVGVVVSGASAVAGSFGGSTGGSNALGWQQRLQVEQSATGQDRGSAGRLAAAGAGGGGGGAGHVTPHTTHSTGSQFFASGANVLDCNQYLQDL